MPTPAVSCSVPSLRSESPADAPCPDPVDMHSLPKQQEGASAISTRPSLGREDSSTLLTCFPQQHLPSLRLHQESPQDVSRHPSKIKIGTPANPRCMQAMSHTEWAAGKGADLSRQVWLNSMAVAMGQERTDN